MQLIIPALNEERRLPSTLRALRAYVLAACEGVGPVEVIVVDNASTDATADVARSLDSPAMTVRVVTCAQRGKGAAVRAGIAATDADIVAFMDADGATELPALVAAVSLIEGGADVAVASRALPASVTWDRHSRIRAAGAAIYRRGTHAVVPSVVDTQCGFKVFRGDLARSVFDETVSSGFSFDVEVLARCAARGVEVVEFPVMWQDVPGSTFIASRHGASSFVELLAIGLRMRRLRRSEAHPQVTRLPLAETVPAPPQIQLAAES
jgi:dolichyl-phosphate beta-glucosyltransferase